MNDNLTLPLFGNRASRAEQIFAAFEAFHRANPDIWKHFKFYADQARASGRKHFSSDAIFHRIRWYVHIETRSDDGFKLNDHFTAYYGRLYHEAVPEAEGFFMNRPTGWDEAELAMKLRALL